MFALTTLYRSTRCLTIKAVAVNFADFDSVDVWLEKQPLSAIKEQFKLQGFAIIHNIINRSNIPIYQTFYNQMLNKEIDSSNHRHDLGSNEAQKISSIENITQIMWPSEYISNLKHGPFHERTTAIANMLIGDDSAFDFDMLVCKAEYTNTDVPWHQDASYWLPGFTDKRAASFWCALDDVYTNNGCMWFMPYSTERENDENMNELYAFERAHVDNHVIQINDEKFSHELNNVYDGGITVGLSVGSCTVHHSRTPHSTKGNTTSNVRRAIIANYRPKAMVEYEREHGFDHGQKGLADLVK